MGQKQSSSPNKKCRPVKSKVEATEIVDLESSGSTSSQTDPTKVISNASTESAIESPELTPIIRHVEELECSINKMTESEIDLYFATLKDNLHNYWRKVYDIKNIDDDVKNRKAETIDRIKIILKNLDERYLKGRMSY
ncbi:uncharacterized protein LOC108913901 [Anoplophora glabripennis]|uniref:Uncharacterized protein n=1 Tax=Anoplophora glabripennis TaxID=217634 RepID=V5I7K9_ANOGL|nr:uncharacterized protein LOC108913901 [Anoplophora glabripennis]